MVASAVHGCERLSALEATWLALDDERHTQHVVLMAVFERRAWGEPELRAHARKSLAAWTRARRRLAAVPGVHHPVLVDFPEFDFDSHLHFVRLAAQGKPALQELVARVYAEPLERSRALWEQWYVTGSHPERLVLLTKAHACLFDGRGHLPGFTELLRGAPDARTSQSPAHLQVPPQARQLLTQEWQHYLGSLAALGRELGQAPWRTARALVSGVSQLWQGALAGEKRSSELSGEVCVDWLALRTSQAFARVAARPYASEHELVLDVVMRALQDVKGTPARALSARLGDGNGRAQRPELRVLPSNGAGAPGPRAGQNAFAAAESVANLTFVNLATWAAHVARRRRAFDVLVCEVPAPAAPAYLLDARLLEFYALLPRCMNNPATLAHTQFSEQLCFGFAGTRGVGPSAQDVLGELIRE
ncbi:MAG TPA: wax ester/triacylglycerol synthase domain-containing protein [Polyangiaceae bacterium]|nr:wax ester/triacylglycerol synthase domain-containing protein [Polyangiaceae bacterium]